MKIAIVGVGAKGGDWGGAENLFQGLVSALDELGVTTRFICPVCDETSFEGIMEGYLRFYDLDLSSFDGVISTKAPSYILRHPNHICYLVHTVRVFYDMFDKEFEYATKELHERRALIQLLDSTALQYPRVRKIFAIGNEVKHRLRRFNGLDATVLHPGLLNDNFKCGSFDYIFMPGRLHRWKRVDLVINAMQHVQSPVKFKIAGTGADEGEFKKLASQDPRIEFLGRVTDEELVELYSNALCVPFVPVHEDYGYVTIEANRSGKPVITCTDSGEPAHFVQEGNSGFVCQPDPAIIAEKIDLLYQHPEIAKSMGGKGRLATQHITWNLVAQELLSALKN